jgi:hypothetical protein
MMGLGNVLITRVMGPLAGMSYVVYGIVSAFKDWAKAAELVDRAMAAAQQKNMLVKQLAETTKSVAIAKEKVKDLYDFASKSPFSLEGVVKGGEALAKFDNGTLLTKKNLQLVGDAAAASGQRFDTTADAVGQLYYDLAKNQSIAESANQLKEMGVISANTVNQIEALQSTGSNLTATWDLVTKSLEKSKGAMSGLSETLTDLQVKHDTQKEKVLEPAGQVANKDAMLAQKAQNDLFEAAAPTLTNLATILTRVGDSYEYVSSKVTELVASIPGLSSIIGILTGAFSALMLAIAAVFTTNILTGVARFTVLANGAAEATGILKLAMMGLAAVGVEVAEGTTAVGLAMLGLKAVGTLLYTEMWLPLITVMGSVTGVVGGVVVAMAYLYNRMETGVSVVNDYKEATDALGASLQKQIDNMQNASDQAVAYQKALEMLKDAQADLAKDKDNLGSSDVVGRIADYIDSTPQKVAADQARVDQANKALKTISSTKGLAESNEQNQALLEYQKQQQRDQLQLQLDTASPEQRVQILKDRQQAAQQEFLAKRAAERRLNQPDLDSAQKAEIMRHSGSQEMRLQNDIISSQNRDARRTDLQQQIADAQAELQAGPRYRSGTGKRQGQTRKEDEAFAKRAAELNAQIGDNQKSLSNIGPSLTPEELQQKQNQIALIQDKYANAPTKGDTDKSGRDLAKARAAAAFHAQEAADQAKYSTEGDLDQLNLIKAQTAEKMKQLDYDVTHNGLLQEEADAQKAALQNELAARQKIYDLQQQQLASEKKLNDIQQESLDLAQNKSNDIQQESLDLAQNKPTTDGQTTALGSDARFSEESTNLFQRSDLKSTLTDAKNDQTGFGFNEAGDLAASKSIGYQPALAEVKNEQLETTKKILSAEDAVNEKNLEQLETARKTWGIYQDQIDAIEKLRREKKISNAAADAQEAPYRLKKDQAALDLYRAQQSRQISRLQLGSQVAAAGGNQGLARNLNNAAENEQENQMQAQKTQEYYQQNRMTGMGQNESLQKAQKDALEDRQQDLAGKALQPISQISGPVADSLQRVGGGGGVEASNPLLNISQQQLDALQAIQKSLETKPQPRAY